MALIFISHYKIDSFIVNLISRGFTTKEISQIVKGFNESILGIRASEE